MDDTGPANRRKHPRARGDMSASVMVLDAQGDGAHAGQQLECHTKDISFQGICLLSDIKIPPGSRLEVTLRNDMRSSVFVFEGVVIWSDFDAKFLVHETGVQFQDTDNIPADWKMLVINLLTETFSRSTIV